MSARRKRILVLDSDEHVLIKLEGALEGRGFDTSTTWDAAEALEMMKSRTFDLMLVGDRPPGLNAGEILRQLQYSRINSPCIVLRVQQDRFSDEYFYSLGALDVISGWQEEQVANRLQQHFSRRVWVAAAG